MSSNIYHMRISLNVLQHLGIGLYSSIPAVLSEIIANAWDADATIVEMQIDPEDKEIEIFDNGHGMDINDINEKYLTIGYARRENGRAFSEVFNRKVMGRKGIGKLSIFSIADTVEIYSKTKDSKINGLRMLTSEIKNAIEISGVYYPAPIECIKEEIKTKIENNGTLIVLKHLHRNVQKTALRKKLARRFSVIGEENNFSIKINGENISIKDRDYFNSLEFIWEFGKNNKFSDLAKNATEKFKFEENSIKFNDKNYPINGWVGVVKESGSLQDGEDNLNKISILVRGKLAQEDILEEFREGGLYTKFLIGEIEANFLDDDSLSDIATSSRQKLKEDDKRYQILKDFILLKIKIIERKRAELKQKKGVNEALKIEPIKNWFDQLKREPKKRAEKLFGKINQIETDENHRKTLYKHAVLAFENIQFRDIMDSFDKITDENLEFFLSIFNDYKDIESTFYYEITSGRIKVIEKLKEHIEDNRLEKIIQSHIFENLWLLDPSWERATEPVEFEKRVHIEFEKIDKKNIQHKTGRIDLKYRKTTGKHIIIELKRANVRKKMSDIFDQVDPYIKAIKAQLKLSGNNEPVEAICILGKLPLGWEDTDERKEDEKALQAKNIRVLTYQSLIDQSYALYKEYLDKQTEKGRLLTLLKQIDELN